MRKYITLFIIISVLITFCSCTLNDGSASKNDLNSSISGSLINDSDNIAKTSEEIERALVNMQLDNDLENLQDDNSQTNKVKDVANEIQNILNNDTDTITID